MSGENEENNKLLEENKVFFTNIKKTIKKENVTKV